MSNKINQIRGIHSELNNIIEILNQNSSLVEGFYLDQIQSCINKLKEVTNDDPGIVVDPRSCHGNGNWWRDHLLLMAKNLRSWIEDRHHITSNKGELIGALGKVINSEILQKRCFDILDNPNAQKDTVVREATLCLTEAVMNKLNVSRDEEIGWNDVEKRIEVFDNNKDNHDFFELVRLYRNIFGKESRHKLVDDLPQEDAVKIIAFLDLLITKIENANVKSKELIKIN